MDMEQLDDFESIAPSGWRAVRYGNRSPKRGKRADKYHAIRTYPNRTQFLRKGYTMVDTLGRMYNMADGMDRLEAELAGIVSSGDPALVEPKRVFEGGDTPTIVFERLKGVSVGRSGIRRGPQMLYCYLPPVERKDNPDLALPGEGETLKFVHMETGMPVVGTVTIVHGTHLPVHATGSVVVEDLVFFNTL